MPLGQAHEMNFWDGYDLIRSLSRYIELMLSLNKEQILKIQNNEGQYLMIDYADELYQAKVQRL